MTDYLGEAVDLIEHHAIPPEQRAGLLLLASIAEAVHVLATTPRAAEGLAGCTTTDDATPAPQPAVWTNGDLMARGVLDALDDFLSVDIREYETDAWERALDRLRRKGRALFGMDEIRPNR